MSMEELIAWLELGDRPCPDCGHAFRDHGQWDGLRVICWVSVCNCRVEVPQP